jgi:hypothetical protein
VWLGRRGTEDQEPERLEVEVYRRLDDGVPLAVTTIPPLPPRSFW